MHRLFLVACILYSCTGVFAQKMLLLERANRAKTTKLYIGDDLRYRMAGPENYWYHRTITDMLPESQTLLLDNFSVKLDNISVIKVQRKGIWRIVGGALFTFGASLTLATTVGKVIYRDKNVDAPKLYGLAAVSLGAGWWMNTPKKLKLGKKHRLRLVEVKFPDPIIPPPPGKQ
jgi:hypothetical protein